MIAALSKSRPDFVLLLQAAVFGLVAGVATSTFLAISGAGTRFLWDVLPGRVGMSGSSPW